MPCYNKAVLGGTFDYLHKGHRKLLDVAFALAQWVTIGLTTDEFAKSTRQISHSYQEREKALTNYLSKYEGRYEVVPISDPVGPATQDFQLLVVSEQTLPGARLVNEARQKIGKDKLIVVVVPLELAYDKKPISATRIRMGEIDEEGRKVERKQLRCLA